MEEDLLEWFALNGRDLPWRHTKDPYSILVSEVMLQQTQVDRVRPYYLEWINRWSTIESLAAASLADVITAWQGLGYNRRAVNLHRAAQMVTRDGWPDNLRTLPGVGEYTAAAIARFAFEEKILPVDVNVTRVSQRTGYEFSYVAASALMDLGATICLARIPQCDSCPLSPQCMSRGRKFEPKRKQSAFEGSFRQKRSHTLRLLTKKEYPLSSLDDKVVHSLLNDGLVVIEDGIVRLPL